MRRPSFVVQSSFYSLAQLTTAFAWGMVSDRCGRKQLIVMSNFFSTVLDANVRPGRQLYHGSHLACHWWLVRLPTAMA